METVDYPTRAAMVDALVAARKDGIEVEVVGNGRTLRYPDEYGAGLAETSEAAPEPSGGTQEPPAPAGQGAGTPDPTPEPPDASGTPDAAPAAEKPLDISDLTWQQVKDALEIGTFTKEQVLDAELAGKNRKGVLALVMDE